MSDQLLGHDAIVLQFLVRARKYLKVSTFEGEEAIQHMTKWEWFEARCDALSVINDTISRIYMEETCTTQNSL